MASPTLRRQAAMKRAAARKLNGLAAGSPAAGKPINGNTLKRVARALTIVHDDAQPPAQRLKLYAWILALSKRFERTELTGKHGAPSYTVPARITISVPADRCAATAHAVRTLCSAHGYTELLAGRVWVGAPGDTLLEACP